MRHTQLHWGKFSHNHLFRNFSFFGKFYIFGDIEKAMTLIALDYIFIGIHEK